jgi:bifunctional enzyme Fae/Hps
MLSHKKRYLQVALNSTLTEAQAIINCLPVSDRIIIEAGTPMIKAAGMQAVESITRWWGWRVRGVGGEPYVVADLKVMDRGATEVALAREAGASAVVALGQAPLETIDAFIETCVKSGIDSMIDMMNVEQPVKIIRKFRKLPTVIMLHRGVDETEFNKSKPIPYLQINKIRATANVMIAVAGGDTPREVQRAVFNGADIVVVWKEFYQSTNDTGNLAETFLKEIK